MSYKYYFFKISLIVYLLFIAINATAHAQSCPPDADFCICQGQRYNTVQYNTPGYTTASDGKRLFIFSHDTSWDGSQAFRMVCSESGYVWGSYGTVTIAWPNIENENYIPGINNADTTTFTAYTTAGTDNSHTNTYTGNSCPINIVKRINVKLVDAPTVTETVTRCKRYASDTVNWREHTGLTTSIQRSTFFSRATTGTDLCDAKIFLSLNKFAYDSSSMEYDTVCDFLPRWRNVTNGQTYTANGITRAYDLSHDQINIQFDSVNDPSATSNNLWAGGSYKCPKSYHLTLKVFHHTTIDTQVAVCDSFRWDRKNNILFKNSLTSLVPANDSNIYRWQPEFDDGLGHKWKGCWDTLWLNLTVHHSTYAIDSVAACRTHTWINGTTYTYDENNTSGPDQPSDPLYTFYGAATPTSFTHTGNIVYGDIRDTMRGVNPALPVRTPHSYAGGNAKGCDSIVSLWLKTYPIDTLRDTVLACQHYTWPTSGKTFYSGGAAGKRTHFDTVNAGSIKPNTGISVGPYRAGTFQCDSAFTLILYLDSNYTNATDAPITVCDSFHFYGHRTLYTTEIYTLDAPPTSPAYNQIIGEIDTAARNSEYINCHSTIKNDTLDQIYPSVNPGGRTGLWQHDIYFHEFTKRLHCDSIVHFRLNLPKRYLGEPTNTTQNTSYPFFDSICGEYTWRGAKHNGGDSLISHTPATRDTHYTNLPRTINGCDSTIMVDLYIRPFIADTTHYPTAWNADNNSGKFCPGIRRLGSELLYHDTIYELRDKRVHNPEPFCDSVFIVFQHVWDTTHTRHTATACDSFVWFNAHHSPIDTFYASTTTSVHNPDIHTCDSVSTITITIRHSTDSVLRLVSNSDTLVCEGFQWDSTALRRYTIPDSLNVAKWRDTAQFTSAIRNAAGCDSIVRLPMLIHRNYNINDTATGCDTVFLRDQEGTIKHYTVSQIDRYPGYSSAPVIRNGTLTGCDSIRTKIILIDHADTTHGTDTAVCDQFTWLDTTFTEPVNIPRRFTDYNGDSLKTKIGHCDSAAYLNLSLKPNGINHIHDTACDRYEWNMNRKTYTSIGDTIDSVVTHGLARNGCDTITILNLHICPTAYDTIYDTVCDRLTWFGNIYYNTTTATHTFPHAAVNGCDSVLVLHLYVKRSTSFTDNHIHTECDTLSNWNGYTFTKDTIGFLDTITNAVGCDSVITLNLRLLHRVIDTIDSVGCDSVTWRNKRYHVSTIGDSLQISRTLTYIAPAANGCDSLQALSLQLHNSKIEVRNGAGIDTVIACETYTWEKNNHTFNRSTSVPSPANDNRPTKYTHDTLKTIEGCDSAVYLLLTLNHNTPDTTFLTDTFTHCGQFSWTLNSRTRGTWDTVVYQRGFELVTPHTLIHSIENTSGCDSILKLTVNVSANRYADTLRRGRRPTPSGQRFEPSVCESYTWRGHTYDSTGIYNDTIPKVIAGLCDSIYTLDIIIGHATDSVIDKFICNGTYRWHDSTYTATTDSATFTLATKNAHGCDSVHRLNLTINSDRYYVDSAARCDNFTWINNVLYTTSQTDGTVTKSLTSSKGCDSVVHLYLIIYPSIAETDTIIACDQYQWPYNNRTYTYSIDTAYNLSPELHTIHGCDTSRRLLLSISHASEYDLVAHGCEIYKWTLSTGEVKTARMSNNERRNGAKIINGHNEPTWREYVPGGNQYGCDTTTYLVLTLDTNSRGIDHQEFCTYTSWHGHIISSDTRPEWDDDASYFDTVFGVAANGCDSVYILEANTRDSYLRIDTVTACDYHMWRNYTTYFANNNSAMHRSANAGPNGCDTIYTLNLTIYHGTHNIIPENPCDSIIWHGTKYTRNGKYIYRYTDTANGCPSTDTLVLTVRRSVLQTIDMGRQCNSFRWGDSTYTATTTDQRVYRAVNGCDSTRRMTVIINPSNFDEDSFVPACDSLLYRGTYYYRDTMVAVETGGLNNYQCPNLHRTHISIFHRVDSIANISACDSLTWSANGQFYDTSVNGVTVHDFTQQGCDSNITLNLTINYGFYNTLNPVSTCDKYTWTATGNTYTTSTTARQILGHTIHNCDSANLLPITIRPHSVRDTNVTACERYNWPDRGRIYTASTTDSSYRCTGCNAVGCDSLIRLNVTILYNAHFDTNIEICDSLLWRNKSYTIGGIYYDTLPNFAANGCDSITAILLTVHPSFTQIDEREECDRYTWPVNSVTYNANTSKKIISGRDAFGCDSTYTLNLKIKHSVTASAYQHACDSFGWHGSVYRTSGNYQHIEHRDFAYGCDTTTNLRLVIGKTSYHAITERACDYYIWYGSRYTASGNYSHLHDTTTVHNISGCDSIEILALHLERNDTIVHETIACDSLRWFGATYKWSQRGITNTYPNAAGCHTVDILNLRMGFPTTKDLPDITACDSLSWKGTTYRRSIRAVFDTLTTLGCDSTIRIRIAINPSYHTTDNVGNQCGSYTWINGTTYTASNNTATYHSPNANPNGCDTIITLNLTIQPQGPYRDTVVSCNAYIYLGTTITRDTTISIPGTSAYGCDSTTLRNINITHSFSQTIDTSACDSIRWMNNTYSTSGHYQRVFPSNVPDCDSVLTLNFTVLGRSSHTTENLTGCPGYRWQGEVFTNSIDTTIDLGPTSAGCDSTASLHYIVTETARFSDTVHRACDHFVWNGQTFTSDTVILATFNMASGCDSLSLLRIYVRPTPTAIDQIHACDSFTWRNGITYRGSTSSPTYRVDWGGFCDSVYTLHLALNRSIQLSTTKAAKDYYQWGDTLLLESGLYTKTFPAANGCDSTITLRLTITDQPLPVLVCNDDKLLMVNHYPYGLNFDRVDYVAYRWYRNGVLIPNANLDYYSEYGYTLLNGCYYVEVAINPEQTEWLPSEPFCIGTYGIDYAETSVLQFAVMPNPVSAGSQFTIRANGLSASATLDIYDLQGRRIHSDTFNGTEQTYTLPLASGIYTIRLTTPQGQSTTKKLIVK